MALVLIGGVIELAAGLAGSRLLRTVLYDVDAADPLVFGLAPFVLLAVCLVASWVPTYTIDGQTKATAAGAPGKPHQ